MLRLMVVLGVMWTAVACGGSTTSGGPVGASGASGAASGGVSGTGTGGGGGFAPAGGSGGFAPAGGTTGIGGSGAFQSVCQYPGDCTLFATNCCGGYCGEHPITGWIAVIEKSLPAVQQLYCSDPVACPDCETAPHESYVAVCRSAECVAVDVRSDAISACNGDQDCRLRYGSSCCELCNGIPQQLIAVRTDGQLEKEVCSPFEGACPPCAPPGYPAGALALCIAGHCQVVWESQPGG
jgi:hypothetical protein